MRWKIDIAVITAFVFFNVSADGINASMGGGAGGSFCIADKCYGGTFEIRIGTDSETGKIKWEFTGGVGKTTGSGYSLSGDVMAGTGNFGSDGLSLQGSAAIKNVTITGKINDDGSYGGSADISLSNGMILKGNINGSDITAGVGVGVSSGNYSMVGGTVTKSGTLYDPSTPAQSGWDIFWSAVFAPGMAIGEAVAATQIGITKVAEHFTSDDHNGSDNDYNVGENNYESGGMTPVPDDYYDDVDEDGDDVMPPNDNTGSDDSQAGGVDEPDESSDSIDFSKIANDTLDKFAVVGPTIPHSRVLWLFSGESAINMGVDLINSFTSGKIKEGINEISEGLGKIKDHMK